MWKPLSKKLALATAPKHPPDEQGLKFEILYKIILTISKNLWNDPKS